LKIAKNSFRLENRFESSVKSSERRALSFTIPYSRTLLMLIQNTGGRALVICGLVIWGFDFLFVIRSLGIRGFDYFRIKNRGKPSVDFINISRAAFMPIAPKSVRLQSSRQYFFTLLGSTSEKAVLWTLMKLSPRIAREIHSTFPNLIL